MNRSVRVFLCGYVALLMVGCTRSSGVPADASADAGTSEEVEGSDGCAAICADRECGVIGECSCGDAGDGTCIDGIQVCNPETYRCECAPSCGATGDWECGSDGCGGSCGECPPGETCSNDETYQDDVLGIGEGWGGTCLGCSDLCNVIGLECGVFPTELEGLPECDCGSCPGGLTCYEGTCDCVPDCSGKDCGGDDCDGTCGVCPGAQDICSADGECICQAECAGKVCGDDGCGGQCGLPCEAGLVCVEGGCVTCTEDDDCDDGLECTTDTCTNGECSYGIANGPCNDSNKCTSEETCIEGQCMGDMVDCDDGNPCTDDSCDPAVGCQHTATSGGDCDGGLGKCVEGECLDKIPSCPGGWSLRSGQCYRPFDPDSDVKLTWTDAEAFCAGFGGHLPSIHDEATNDYVKELINKTNFTDDTTWIGLGDAAMEGAFVWTDGTNYDFSAWAGGQPNNWGGCWIGDCPQNCVAIEDPIIGFGGWNDFECDDEYRTICQRAADWN